MTNPEGSAATPQSAFTYETLPAVLGQPQATAQGQYAGQIQVTVVPGSGGGSADSFTVKSTPGNKTRTVTAPANQCIVSKLTSGTAYTFAATATNAVGTTSPSVSSEPVVAP